ncbi:MAG TPA: hypothetical protein VIM41_03815 [Gammaproteobacteria bacterium]
MSAYIERFAKNMLARKQNKNMINVYGAFRPEAGAKIFIAFL